jgi:hypothetical protein
MNADELNKCAALLGEVAKNFVDLPTANRDAVQAGLTCVMAQSYVAELAAHIHSGMEPFDAYEAAARGTLELPASAATVFQMLTMKPTK